MITGEPNTLKLAEARIHSCRAGNPAFVPVPACCRSCPSQEVAGAHIQLEENVWSEGYNAMVVWALVVGWCPWLPGSDWALCWAIFGSGLICLPELRSVLLAALPVWVGAALPNQFGALVTWLKDFRVGPAARSTRPTRMQSRYKLSLANLLGCATCR